MKRIMLKSKLHKATVTNTEIDYEGSLSIDEDIMDAADLIPNEQIEVYNITNGKRFTTYAIKAERGSKAIGIKGAAARLAMKGDEIIIVSYAILDDKDAKGFSPHIVRLDNKNRINGDI